MRLRNTQTRPLLGEQVVETEHRAGVELAWIVVVGVVVVVAAIWFSVPDWLLSRMEGSGRHDLNGLLALIVVIPLGATVFASRRYRDAVGAQRELAHLSDHDAMTLLPNRRGLNVALPKAMAEADRVNAGSGVFFVDLDGFKAVNDTYGHEVGDRLMVVVAERLREICGDHHWVARYGGDEFVIIDPTPSSYEACTRFAEKVINQLSEPFELDEDRIRISASIGITFGELGDDPVDVVKDADLAMYEAKRGESRVAVFNETMRASLTPATAGVRLERAIENGEFRMMYQPMVLLESGAVVGVEALLRWDDPDRGEVEPIEFLPALEATGLIVPVGRWVMGEVCRRARHWADLMPPGVPALRVSMNVSPRELSQSDFVEDLAEALDVSGAEPASIYLEANETSLIADSRKAWLSLTGASRLGVGLALDNFGRGYTSLGHLRNFDFGLVKLDAPFAAAVAAGSADAEMVCSVIDLAGKLGIAVLAEGLESDGVLRSLADAGCQLGQGNVISGPLTASTVDKLIAEGLAGVTLHQQTRSTTSASPIPRDVPDVGNATVVLPRLRQTGADRTPIGS